MSTSNLRWSTEIQKMDPSITSSQIEAIDKVQDEKQRKEFPGESVRGKAKSSSLGENEGRATTFRLPCALQPIVMVYCRKDSKLYQLDINQTDCSELNVYQQSCIEGVLEEPTKGDEGLMLRVVASFESL